MLENPDDFSLDIHSNGRDLLLLNIFWNFSIQIEKQNDNLIY